MGRNSPKKEVVWSWSLLQFVDYTRFPVDFGITEERAGRKDRFRGRRIGRAEASEKTGFCDGGAVAGAR
jgi:hypothetical protein